MTNTALDKAIAYFGNQSALAAALEITREAVSQWDVVPVKRAVQIERVTKGKIKRHELRPDIFGARP
jgi:DNA-binding transcriptional regulator YdaS (Cro superfamily)